MSSTADVSSSSVSHSGSADVANQATTLPLANPQGQPSVVGAPQALFRLPSAAYQQLEEYENFGEVSVGEAEDVEMEEEIPQPADQQQYDPEPFPTLEMVEHVGRPHKGRKITNMAPPPPTPAQRSATPTELLEEEENEMIHHAIQASLEAHPKQAGKGRTKKAKALPLIDPTFLQGWLNRANASSVETAGQQLEYREVQTSGSCHTPTRQWVSKNPQAAGLVPKSASPPPQTPTTPVQQPVAEETTDEVERKYRQDMAELQKAMADAKAAYDNNKQWRAVVDAQNAKQATENRSRRSRASQESTSPKKKVKAASSSPTKNGQKDDGWTLVKTSRKVKSPTPPAAVTLDNSQHTFCSTKFRSA